MQSLHGSLSEDILVVLLLLATLASSVDLNINGTSDPQLLSIGYHQFKQVFTLSWLRNRIRTKPRGAKRNLFPSLDHVIFMPYFTHFHQILTHVLFLRSARVPTEEGGGNRSSPCVSLAHCNSPILPWAVNNAFSLRARFNSTVSWKTFLMKITTCLKLKLISYLNLLAFYFSTSLFLILFDMQRVYTDMIEFVFFFSFIVFLFSET